MAKVPATDVLDLDESHKALPNARELGLTGRELAAQLMAHQDLKVVMEGCDCYGGAEAVQLATLRGQLVAVVVKKEEV